MIIYSFSEVRERLASFLAKALRDGQVKFQDANGQIFVLRPERQPKKSPFEVQSISLPITTDDILAAIRESRERY
ncbi:MAG: hypothetical protein IT331_11525 [Anaerolineae bacterium]|nr:hypothetical protein [Anaerolineae bacterium]